MTHFGKYENSFQKYMKIALCVCETNGFYMCWHFENCINAPILIFPLKEEPTLCVPQVGSIEKSKETHTETT